MRKKTIALASWLRPQIPLRSEARRFLSEIFHHLFCTGSQLVPDFSLFARHANHV